VGFFFLLIKRLLTILFTKIQVLRDFHSHKQKSNPIKTFPAEETYSIIMLILKQDL